MVYNGSTSPKEEKSWSMSLYILIHCRMANVHRQPREPPSTPPFQGLQGLVVQGLFNLSDLPMECFHSKEAHDHYYASFIGHCVKVEYTINMHFFFQYWHSTYLLSTRLRASCFSPWPNQPTLCFDILFKHLFYGEWYDVWHRHVWSNFPCLD